MNIHIIVVAYGLADDLLKLQQSADAENVIWHLFLHSKYPDVEAACEEFRRRCGWRHWFYNVGHNRGLSASWNEGLIRAYENGADIAMIANDDAVMGEGDVQRIAEAAINNRDRYFVTGMGFDQRSRQHTNMQFCMGAVNPIALEQIGYFDQNFFPIYFEDIDWFRRAQLAGLQPLVVQETNIVHAGSKSIHSNDALMRQNHETFPRNREYYLRKWGGDISYETHLTPFGDESLGLCIRAEQIDAPYGPAYDRIDKDIVRV